MATTALGGAAASLVRGRLAGLAAAVLAAAVAIIAATSCYLAAARKAPGPFDQQPPTVSTSSTVVELFAAGALAAGVFAIRAQHPYPATGLALVAIAVVLPFWATWTWLPASIRAGVLAAAPLSVAGISLLLLRWDGRRSDVARRGLRAVFVAAVAAALVHLLGYNPFDDPGCIRVCDDSRPVLGGVLDTRQAAGWSCWLTIAALAIAALAILRTGAPGAPRAVVLAGLGALAAFAFTAITRSVTWTQLSPPLWRLLVNPLGAAFVGVSAFVLGMQTARTRAAVQRLVARLSLDATDPGPVAPAIRGIQFALADGTGWVDSNGWPAADPTPSDGQAVVLFDEDGPAFRLILAERANQADLHAGLSPATRLALQNARLVALSRARLSAVQDSQKRIVATADAERQRIERDLHDGAQQSLVGVAFHIRASLPGADPASAHLLSRAEAQVHIALARLRQLAHGIFPTVLAQEGLEAAIEELVSSSSVKVSYDVRMSAPLPSEIAMAGYAMIVAMLDAAGTFAGARAHVSVATAKQLTVRVEIHGSESTDRVDRLERMIDFTDVIDRVGAAGGTFALSNDQGCGCVATAVIPCVS